MTYSHACAYVRRVLEEDYFKAYTRIVRDGFLIYELTNIIEVCAPLVIGLEENDRFLWPEVSFMIANYLQEN